MTGTILNAAAIVIGGAAGLTMARPISAQSQQVIKVLLGLFTIFVGLKLFFTHLGGSVGEVFRQVTIVVLAMMLGRITGRFLRIQKGLSRLGQHAQARMASPESGRRLNEGFLTGTILFCVGPIAILGAVQDGLEGQWQTLAIKAVMDGLATVAFVGSFGWGVILSVIPVVAYQGTLTLGTQWLAPYLEQAGMVASVQATGGMLVFCIALIILEVRRVELGDYLPALLYAPLLAWVWS